MLAVHVVDHANRALYEDELDQHHRLRHDIYIGERKWKDLVGRDGREADRFDTPNATYLLALADDREVAGGTRLLRSEDPTLLSEVFPGLADVRGFERAPDVLEWTRFFVAPRFRDAGRPSETAGLVSAALMVHCLDEGVRKLNAVGETFWIPRISVLGWRPKPLGLTIEQDGMSICAFAFDPTEEALATTCAFYGFDVAPTLRRRERPAGRPRAIRASDT